MRRPESWTDARVSETRSIHGRRCLCCFTTSAGSIVRKTTMRTYLRCVVVHAPAIVVWLKGKRSQTCSFSLFCFKSDHTHECHGSCINPRRFTGISCTLNRTGCMISLTEGARSRHEEDSRLPHRYVWLITLLTVVCMILKGPSMFLPCAFNVPCMCLQCAICAFNVPFTCIQCSIHELSYAERSA